MKRRAEDGFADPAPQFPQAPSPEEAEESGPSNKKRRKVCDECGREFTKSSERPFQCPACPKNFSRNDTLNRHLKVHKDLKAVSKANKDSHYIVEGSSNSPLEETPAPELSEEATTPTLHDPATHWSPHGWPGPHHGPELYSEPIIVNPMRHSQGMMPHESNGLNAFATLALNLDVGHNGSVMAPPPPVLHGMQAPNSPIVNATADTHALGLEWDPASQAIFGTDLLDSIPHEMAPFGFDDLKWPPELLYDDHAGLLQLEEQALSSPASAQATSYIDWLTLGHRDELDEISGLWPSIEDTRSIDGFSGISQPVTPGYRGNAGPLEPLAACSPDFLDQAARAFFLSASNTSRNVLHGPSFDHRRHSPLLRLAICASGAHCMGTVEGTDFANEVYNRMSLLLQQHWDDTGKFQTDHILCALLTQKHLIRTGKPHMLSRAFTLAGQTMAAARRCGLFSKINNPTHVSPDPDALPMDDPTALELIWRKWANGQSVARLVGAMLHMETVISGLFPGDIVPPGVPLASLCLSVSTMQSDAFEATDAMTWAKLYKAHKPPHLVSVEKVVLNFYDTHATDSPAPRALDSWALLAVLDVIRGHGRSRSLARLPSSAGPKSPDIDTLQALERCRRTFMVPSRGQGPSRLQGIIDMRFHGTSAFCSIDNELIQVAAGRDGASRAREAFAQLGTAWAQTPLTRRALVHVGQIWRIFPHAPDEQVSPFPDFESLPFKGALVLLAYSLVTANQADEGVPAFSLTDDLEWSEVGTVGIDGATLTPMELASSKPVVRFIMQGGPCSFMGMQPLSTVAGRAALVDFCSQTHARRPQSAASTAIGQAYADILSTWTAIVHSGAHATP